MVTFLRGMPLQVRCYRCFHRVDITQRSAACVVLLMSHVTKDGSCGGIQLCCLCEIKTDVFRTINYAHKCLDYLASACGGSLGCNKPRISSASNSAQICSFKRYREFMILLRICQGNHLGSAILFLVLNIYLYRLSLYWVLSVHNVQTQSKHLVNMFHM